MFQVQAEKTIEKKTKNQIKETKKEREWKGGREKYGQQRRCGGQSAGTALTWYSGQKTEGSANDPVTVEFELR